MPISQKDRAFFKAQRDKNLRLPNTRDIDRLIAQAIKRYIYVKYKGDVSQIDRASELHCILRTVRYDAKREFDVTNPAFEARVCNRLGDPYYFDRLPKFENRDQ